MRISFYCPASCLPARLMDCVAVVGHAPRELPQPSRLRSIGWLATFAVALVLCSGVARGVPPPAVGGPLLAQIQAMPEGQWKRVSLNFFSDVWTPSALRPLTVGSPYKIISAWSGFAWDTTRGDLVIYGGGHANYAGNDVYRWRGSSLLWERASLPSDVQAFYGDSGFMAIDGVDAAPSSAHTYDNNIYLPFARRFMTWGGAMYNTGGAFIRPDETNPSAVRKTGPYLFDPLRADGGRVGGTTGSHVQRVAPYPSIVGGNMWENRDLPRRVAVPNSHVNGCTAYAEEDGNDVVYVGARATSGATVISLYKYTLHDVNHPSSDTLVKVGANWNGTSGKTTCAYDPVSQLFVRSGSNGAPFVFWDLTNAGPTNRDQRVDVNASIAAFRDWLNASAKDMSNCALDYDVIDASFSVWCGGGQVWTLYPPAVNGPAGWTIARQPLGGTSVPSESVGTGILGKWKYVAGFDVFIGLQNSDEGAVWIYKPVGWTTPTLADHVNFMPHVALSQPGDGQVFATGDTVPLSVSASDPDGAVVEVEYVANGVPIGKAGSPFTLNWRPAPGTYQVFARVRDTLDAEGVSAVATIRVTAATSTTVSSTVNPATVGVSVSFTASVTGMSPTGSVSFTANGAAIAGCGALALTGTSARTATCSTTSLSVGTHSIVARYGGDTGNQPSTSVPVSQVVQAVATATVLSSSSNPAISGASVTFTGTVTGRLPSGSVRFEVNGATISGCSAVALAGTTNVRTAACSTSLPTGTHTITAHYGGDGTNAASTSAALSQHMATVGGGNNYALASAGSTASASSTLAGWSASGAINGERRGVNWGTPESGWVDNTRQTWPDWLNVNFNAMRTIDRVVVYSVQDDSMNPVEPTPTQTFSRWGVRTFTVQGWNGAAWVILASVSANTLVMRTVSFEPYTTDRIRIHITNGAQYYSRLVEVEAWGP